MRQLHAVPAALLALLIAVSGVLAAEPVPPATPGPSAAPATEPAPSAEPGAEPSAAPPDPSADPTPAPADPAPVDPAPPAPTDPGDASAAPQPPIGSRDRARTAAPTPTAAAATERVIVLLRAGADTTAATAAAQADGARVERTFLNALRGYAATVSPAQARRLAADPRVAAVVPDERIAGPDVLSAQAVPTGVSRIYGRSSAAARIDGVDQRVNADVAIYDTGIDPAHPDLNVAGGYNCTSTNRAAWADQQGHGTHVAGTVGALDNGVGVVGVAPGARVWAVRILDANGEGYLSWWICGLDWIAAQKDPANPARPLFEAVNMSVTRWGRDDADCGYTNKDLLHQAICRVVARGITVVAAAANDSASAAARTPAAYNEVITVSALADTDGKAGGTGGNRCWSWGTYDVDDTFADFSNYGSDVDLIAPGKCIWSTKRSNTYGYSSGTSMAAPHVAGAVALYRASRPEATPAEVRWALRYLGNRSWKTSTDPDGVADILLDVGRIAPLRDFAPTASPPAGGLVAGEAGATWTVPLALGRQSGFIEPVGLRVTAPAPLAAALVGATTLWGAESASSVTITVPPATPAGRYDVVVRAAYRTARIHEVTIPVVVENRPPVASAPKAAFVTGTQAGTTGVPLRFTWAPARDESAVVRYDLGRAEPGAAPVVIATTGSTTRSATRAVPYASARTYSVRAKDQPGNLGPWSAGTAARVAVYQESSGWVTKSRGWTRIASSSSLGGYAITSSTAGALTRVTFTGRAIALVGAKAPNRGRAEIRLDGVLVGTVDAWAATSGARWVLRATAADPTRSHVLEVRVLGTIGRPRFDVDAFLVLR